MQLCEIDDPVFAAKAQWDKSQWPQMRARLEQMFLSRSRDEWCELLEGTDACFAPVLDFSEAPNHPHNQARGMFFESDGTIMPSPAPRLSRTPAAPGKIVKNGENTLEVLQQLGLSDEDIATLRANGAIA
ncbi:formyl-coenzyme A transferase [compost metagenome]